MTDKPHTDDLAGHTPGLRMTPARRRILEAGLAHGGRLVEEPYLTGFERVAWRKNAKALVDAGLLTPYVHGGFEMTEAAIRLATGAE